MSRILIVEDEESIAELEKDYLEISGFEVTITGDGQEGYELFLQEEFDLFILDIMLPGMDGFELCRKIREKADTPIILVSAKKDDVDKIRGLGIGADDYMTKPFSPSELVARVKAHISRYDKLVKSANSRDELIIKGLRIDKKARRLYVNGEEKSLTAKQFDLLVFLAEHPNRVYSKKELFEELWGMEACGEVATVTVHIRRIREQIECNSDEPQFIETLWGSGYRFRL